MKLIIVPFAGGLKRDFDDFISRFDESWDIHVLEYPGHGSRRTESYAKDFADLVEIMAKDVCNIVTNPANDGICDDGADSEYILFGYSMGSIVSYEMAVRNLIPKPKLIVEASHRPPNIEWESKTYVSLDDRTFWSKIRLLGAMDNMEESLLDNRVYRRMYFDPIRQDYRLISTYKARCEKVPGVPAVCFYSKQDVPDDEMYQWKLFYDDIKIYPMGDNHFFIFDHAEEMADIIKDF